MHTTSFVTARTAPLSTERKAVARISAFAVGDSNFIGYRKRKETVLERDDGTVVVKVKTPSAWAMSAGAYTTSATNRCARASGAFTRAEFGGVRAGTRGDRVNTEH